MISTIKLLGTFLVAILLAHNAFAQSPVNMQDSGNPEWIAQCGKSGGYSACENLADQHFRGTGVPKNLRMTAYYLLKACRYGNMDMCAFSGKMANEQVNDMAIYGEALARLCEFSDPSNCTLVWSKFKDPKTPYYSPAFVGGALEKGCENGSGYACYLMANWYDDYKLPPNVRMDANKASIGFQRTCMSEPSDKNMSRAKVKFGCYAAYKYLLGKDGVVKDIAQSKEAFLRTCDMADDAQTCEIVASSFYHGTNGMTQDHSVALPMSERACNMGSEIFCSTAGYLHAEKDQQSKAFEYYKKGCDKFPNEYNCAGAATRSYLANGEKNQVTTDYALKACNQGDGWSCFVYGTNTFYLSSNGNKQWFSKACENGLQDGCEEVKRREEYEANRNNPQYNCPRASCETRTWAEFLKDERAAAKERNDGQRSTFDIGIVSPLRTPTTPFGSSQRAIRNWDNYKENQRCSNPTASGC